MIVAILWICVILLLVIAILEMTYPKVIHEGFANLVDAGESFFWSNHMPRRGDISTSSIKEESGYIRDTRYFADYTDIQNLGVNHDFCRMVTPGPSGELFFACALGGTEGLSSVEFRTKSVKKGFKISRDDYMNMTSVGTMGYCRILKKGDYDFEAMCTPAGASSFEDRTLLDLTPPEDIQTLLNFYSGIMFWLRLYDDMVDYAGNLTIMTAGQLSVEELPPKPPVPRTLEFNGLDQFLRLGEKGQTDLEFGNIIDLRYMRAISFWVYFEEFTNNAHIFDFGDGPGRNNVFMGIIGRGNQEAVGDFSHQPCLPNSSTIPAAPSGAQTGDETTPQNLMETTSANVNDYTCQKPEVFGKVLPPVQPFTMPPFESKNADMIYEVWDSQQRKMHVQVNSVFPLKKWTHIVVSASGEDVTRPDITFYQDGVLINTEMAAWLPQVSATTKNYIGRSNWTNSVSNSSNPDELFKGKLFDFRAYNRWMTPKLIQDTYKWGLEKLGPMAKR
jgi:hypothetical protein